MIKNFKLTVLLCLILGVFFSCDLFLEEDITQDVVVILAPADSVILYNSDIHFWWKDLKGSNQYCLQVAYPCFKKLERLIVDTLMNSNKVQMKLLPGEYQWRVKAVNGYYSSSFSYGSFKVDSVFTP